MLHASQKPKPYDKLPKRKREFVQAYIRSGDAQESYLEVGYKGEGRTLAANARKLLKEVTPYLTDQLKKYSTSMEMGILGLKVVGELAKSDPSGAVRLNAAKELLTRALPEEKEESVVKHIHETKKLSNDELDKRIAQLADKLFIEAKDITHGVQVGETSTEEESEAKGEVVYITQAQS